MGRGEGGEAQEDQFFASSYFLRLSSTRDNELILSCPKLTEMIFVPKISQRSKIFSYFLRLSSTRDNELILSCPKLTEMIFVPKISQRSKIFSKMTRLLDRKEAHRDRIKADYKEK